MSGLLCGCAPGAFTSQSQRIGADDGTDSCRPQLVALDSTGDFFGAQIATGAAVGALSGAAIGGLVTGNWRGALIGAAAGAVAGGTTAYWSALQQKQLDQASLYSQVSQDLERENVQIDKTQLAFDQLSYCRFHQAASINADYAAHRINRATAEAAMAQVRQRAAKDVQLARMISQQIQDRGQQFGVAANNVAPGAGAPLTGSVPPPMEQVTLRAATPLKLRPDPSAPDIAQLPPRQQVSVSTGRNGYALVETPTGARGYVAASDLQGQGRRSVSVATATPAAASGDVRTLAGSNAARRDDFTQSVSVTEKAETSGFELAG